MENKMNKDISKYNSIVKKKRISLIDDDSNEN